MAKQPVHGRASTYNNYKCRCDECRKAWADYIREGGYVRRYQEKKRQEKLQNSEDSANILEVDKKAEFPEITMDTLDLSDPETQAKFLEALKKYGIPSTDGDSN